MAPPPRFHRLRAALAIVVVLAGVSAAAAAQRGFFRFRQREPEIRNVPYNGQFTFVRVNYTTAPGGYWYQGLPAWSHGFPLAEQNLMRILNEISDLGPRTDEINSLRLDDPELFKYPVAYIIEVGWWQMTDSEAAGLRDYLHKGGFLIVDDFKTRGFGGGMGGGGWETFEQNMKRVLPEVRFFEMNPSDPDLSLVLRDQPPRHHPAGLQRRHGRSSAACTKTTIRQNGCRSSSTTTPTSPSSGSGRAGDSGRWTTPTKPTSSA